MSFFLELVNGTDSQRTVMEGSHEVQAMLGGTLTREQYITFLSDLYHVVWHFCPTMAAAASRCPDKFLKVRHHLYHNIAEENGHELFVVKDLAAFDINEEAVVSSEPSFAVESMVAYNYYASEHIHSCSVLGMLYVLEVISSSYGGRIASAIADGLKMSLENGFGFLESHASMDLHHMESLKNVLNSVTDDKAQQAIMRSVQMNYFLFSNILKNLSK